MNSDPIHCGACGVVIGVYEPAVVIERGVARKTSLAKERLSEAVGLTISHLGCASELDGFAQGSANLARAA
jgi:hypothetical protein